MISKIKDMVIIAALIYVCVLLTKNIENFSTSNVALDIAIDAEKDIIDYENRLRHWERYIDTKMMKIETVQEYFDNMNKMEWDKFRNWQKRKVK